MTPFGNPDLASSFTTLNWVGGFRDPPGLRRTGWTCRRHGVNPAGLPLRPADARPAGNGASHAQVTALEKVFDGARNSQGDALYAGWYWDPGVGRPRMASLEDRPAVPAPGNTALNTTLGGGALPVHLHDATQLDDSRHGLESGTVITTAGPSPAFSGLNDAFVPWVLSFNMDLDAPKIFATSGPFTGIGNAIHGHKLHRLQGLPGQA